MQALDTLFSEIFFEGHKCYLCKTHIDPMSIPYDWQMYEVEQYNSVPVRVAPSVDHRNFYGTLLTPSDLKITETTPISTYGFTYIRNNILLSDILDDLAG